MNLRRRLILGLAAALLSMAPIRTAAAQPAINFKELYELLRTQLAGVDESALNQAAVQGLLEQLKPRVQLLGSEAAPAQTNGLGLVATNLFDRAYAYLRVARVTPGLDRQIEAAYAALTATNQLRGLILDLRFAGGHDYAAAAEAAQRFVPAEKPLLDWGQGLRRASATTGQITGPVVVLVNPETRGAAEALAAVLRHHDVALLIGRNTAGDAHLTRDFTLSTGHRIRLAVAPVKVGRGDPIPTTGLKPDIRVEVTSEQERLWYQDPYAQLPSPTLAAAPEPTSGAESGASSTNRPARRRLTEAELVRMMREGETPELGLSAGRTAAAEGPTLRDPALVRALDLLKALSVVRHFRPS